MTAPDMEAPDMETLDMETLDALLADAVAAGVTTGVYVMAADRDGVRYSGGAGTRDGEHPWTADTVAWIA